MSVLQGFPMVSQLTTVTEDGLPNKDAPDECVTASICAGCMWLNDIKVIGGKYTPDYFKDQVYGEAYMGGTAASQYVKLCDELGVKLSPLQGMPALLVAEAHQQIQAGHPVVFTEPDPYVSSSLGWTHVCVFYSEEPGFLTAMDPYIARPVRRTDQEWTQLLLDNQIWILEKKGEEDVTIDLNMPEVARYFELFDVAGKQWKCHQTGKVIQYAILNYYKTNGTKPLCGLSGLGLPISNEIPLQGGAVKQYFERGVLVYDSQHKIDNPPGADDVYPLHLYNDGPGTDPAVPELEQEIEKLKTQISQPEPSQAQIQALQQQLAEAQDKLTKIKALVV